MMFYVGQKVVCIAPHDQWETEGHKDIILPVKDGIYTIRAIYPGVTVPGLYFLLSEIRNQPVRTEIGDVEQRFNAHAFRPIVEKKTDISVFTSMLTPAPTQKVRA